MASSEPLTPLFQNDFVTAALFYTAVAKLHDDIPGVKENLLRVRWAHVHSGCLRLYLFLKHCLYFVLIFGDLYL